MDRDNVVVYFRGTLDRVDPELLAKYPNDRNAIPGIFNLMPPMEGAIEALEKRYLQFHVYLLLTAPWQNESARNDKKRTGEKTPARGGL